MFAVLDANGDLVSVVEHGHDAEMQAAVVAQGKIVYIDAPDAHGHVEPNAEFGGRAALRALDAAELPVVSWRDVEELTHGFTDPTPAHRLLRSHFPKIEAYSTPALMAKAFIGQNYKTSKQIEGFNGIVMGLSLAPYWKAWDPRVSLGVLRAPKDTPNFCIGSNPLCRSACLVTTGQNVSKFATKIKVHRAHALHEQPQAFCAMLAWSIQRFVRYTRERDLRAFVRLNVYSDLPWEVLFPDLFSRFQREVQYYDYTKVPGRRPLPGNYDLTFSYSGTNQRQAESEAQHGRRIAVVFLWKRKLPFPRGFKFMGLPVVDGDISDLRPLDPEPSIVGLRYKTPKGVDVGNLGAFVVPVQRDDDGNYVAPHSARQSHAEEFAD